jgi:aminomethyltransferase
MAYYTVREGRIGDHDVIVARTGYTGEDGFELFIRGDEAATLWDRVMEAGAKYDITPAGLGARDTLRLEASMPLYGNELDEETSPLEAGLSFFVAKEGDYIGAERQRELRSQGAPRKLVMLKLMERGVPRQGYKVLDGEGNTIGEVTSGTVAPHLGFPIAQAFVVSEYARIGTTLNIDIRGRHALAEVVKRPFYKRVS